MLRHDYLRSRQLGPCAVGGSRLLFEHWAEPLAGVEGGVRGGAEADGG